MTRGLWREFFLSQCVLFLFLFLFLFFVLFFVSFFIVFYMLRAMTCAREVLHVQRVPAYIWSHNLRPNDIMHSCRSLQPSCSIYLLALCSIL